MRRFAILYVLSAALVSACDRETAPKALGVANDVEQKLWHGWNRDVLRQLYLAESFSNPFWRDSTRSTILLAKDGETERFDALVVERVFIPPKGEGLPVSRRSFVAWLPGADYGILAATETTAEDYGPLADYEKADEFLNPRPRLVAPHAQQDDWWMGRSGKVVILPEAVGSKCPFENGGGDAEADSSRRVTCDVVTYKVELAGEFVRRLELRHSLLPESMKKRHHILVAMQSVRGIRFTVLCHPTELITGTPIYSGCNYYDPLAFWRSNAQFAPFLGVDVTQMERVGSFAPPFYGRTLRAGSDKKPDGPRVVRWTLSYPDGTVAERDSTFNFPGFRNDRLWLEQCTNGMGYGGRRQCLFRQIGQAKMRSRYGVFVLDVEEGAGETNQRR